MGENGRSAGPASAGANAGSISLLLTAPKAESRTVLAEGTAEWAGKRWEIAGENDLFLSARGGDGGAGGCGEEGQNGGRGMDGQDSSQYQDATVGLHGSPSSGVKQLTRLAARRAR